MLLLSSIWYTFILFIILMGQVLYFGPHTLRWTSREPFSQDATKKLIWYFYFIKRRWPTVHSVPIFLSRFIFPAFFLGYLWIHQSMNIIVWPIFIFLKKLRISERRWGLSDFVNTGNWGHINPVLLNHAACMIKGNKTNKNAQYRACLKTKKQGSPETIRDQKSISAGTVSSK